MGKKGHQYLDVVRPLTRINVSLERRRKESHQFRRGKYYKNKIKGRKEKKK